MLGLPTASLPSACGSVKSVCRLCLVRHEAPFTGMLGRSFLVKHRHDPAQPGPGILAGFLLDSLHRRSLDRGTVQLVLQAATPAATKRSSCYGRFMVAVYSGSSKDSLG